LRAAFIFQAIAIMVDVELFRQVNFRFGDSADISIASLGMVAKPVPSDPNIVRIVPLNDPSDTFMMITFANDIRGTVHEHRKWIRICPFDVLAWFHTMPERRSAIDVMSWRNIGNSMRKTMSSKLATAYSLAKDNESPILTFGKYEGLHIIQVLIADPEYFVRKIANIDEHGNQIIVGYPFGKYFTIAARNILKNFSNIDIAIPCLR